MISLKLALPPTIILMLISASIALSGKFGIVQPWQLRLVYGIENMLIGAVLTLSLLLVFGVKP